MYGGDEVNAVVLDVGSYQVKAGYAGEDTPKFVFPSVRHAEGSPAVGAVPGDGGMEVDGEAARSGRQLHLGNHGLAYRRDGMEVVSPFRGGVLSDWEAVEALWDHALKDQMRVATEEHPVMLAEPSDNTREAREKAVQLMFEKYKVPALFMSRNAVLSTFSTGRQTALVVDAGHESTVVAAVHDGYVLHKSVLRSPLGGHLLTKCMLAAVEAKGVTVHPRYAVRRIEKAPGQFEVKREEPPGTTASYRRWAVEAVAQDIKDSTCRVSDAAFDPEANANIPTVTYELPDGQEIHVGAARFVVPEVLFNPGLLAGFGDVGAAALGPARAGEPLVGLQTAVNACIGRCDVDVRRELYAGAILTGGTSLFSTLRDRLERELGEVAPQMAKVKVVCPANSVERRFSVWIGGSILASLGSFQQMWMSKAEYEEHGAGLIAKKSQ